jgi:uncharacterized repeat protein (TIGR03803 family)
VLPAILLFHLLNNFFEMNLLTKHYQLLTLLIFISFGRGIAQPTFFGTTTEGNKYYVGAIYTADLNGENYQVIFEGQAGAASPLGKLVEVSSGVFYGMTPFSHAYNGDGVIFEFNTNTDIYSVKHTFSYTDGSFPEGSLIKAANGKLYGLAKDGGANEEGVIFEYDYNVGTYTKLVDLDYATTGGYPRSSFLEASNGKFYASMSEGGVNGYGTIIEFDPSTNILTKRADFNGIGNGNNAEYGLVERNGTLYGFTSYGGLNNSGVLFEFDISTFALSNLHDFPNGAVLIGTPIIASNDKLYGITRGSGINAAGELFEYDFNTSSLTNKVQMDDFGYAGAVGTLLEYSGGKLLGMCQGGGVNDNGAIFEYDFITSTLSIKIDFEIQLNAARESFILGNDGNIYGFASSGGTSKSGSIYRYDPTMVSVTELFSFNALDVGYYPEDLIQTTTGKLYGVNKGGGVYGSGTLFEMDPNTYEVTPLVQFKAKAGSGSGRGINAIDLNSPHALVEASNGKIYGRTNRGGGNGRGVIFEYDPIGLTITEKSYFTEMTGNNGSGTRGGLLEVNGKLYGASRRAGPSGGGTIFEYDISTSSFSTIVDLGAIGISEPSSNLVLAPNGKLYGVSNAGGTNDRGTIYEYDIDNEIASVKINFNDVSGVAAFGGLIVADNNKLLGMTYGGGANGKGEIYEYNLTTNTYTTLASFDGIVGDYPTNDLLAASNGKFYGLGSSSFFEFNNITNTISKKNDLLFSGASRFEPAALFEACKEPLFDQPSNIQQCAGIVLTIDLNSPNTDSYVWKKEGEVLVNQSSGVLTIDNPKGSDSGAYTCELTNLCGTVVMTVDITIDQIDVVVDFDGTKATVSATGGTLPYSYSTNSIDLQSSPTFALANGQYIFTVQDANNCESSTTQALIITALSAESNKYKLSVYPNPTTAIIYIDGLLEMSSIKIRDGLGKVVFEEISSMTNPEISLTSLSEGIYIMETKSPDGRIERFRIKKD